jgi:hypothetical protein
MRLAVRALHPLLLLSLLALTSASCADQKTGVSVTVTGSGIGDVRSVALTVHGPDGKSEALSYDVSGTLPSDPLVTITFPQPGSGSVSIDAVGLDASQNVLASGSGMATLKGGQFVPLEIALLPGGPPDGGPGDAGPHDAGPDADVATDVPQDLVDLGRDVPPTPDLGTDAPTDAGVDAQDMGPDWTPAVLDQANQLAYWLEGSAANLVISNGTIGLWKDLSQNHNDASNSQAGPTPQPAAVNGHDAVQFTSYVALQMADATSLQLAADQFYLVGVARAADARGYFFSKATSGFGGGGSFYMSGLEFFVDTATDADGGTSLFPTAHLNTMAGDIISWNGSVFDDGQFHIVALRRTNSFELQITVDDQPPQTASTGSFDLSQVGMPVNIGIVNYGNFHPPVDFTMAEVLLVHDARSGVIADADVANLHAYLKAKYGL